MWLDNTKLEVLFAFYLGFRITEIILFLCIDAVLDVCFGLDLREILNKVKTFITRDDTAERADRLAKQIDTLPKEDQAEIDNLIEKLLERKTQKS